MNRLACVRLELRRQISSTRNSHCSSFLDIVMTGYTVFSGAERTRHIYSAYAANRFDISQSVPVSRNSPDAWRYIFRPFIEALRKTASVAIQAASFQIHVNSVASKSARHKRYKFATLCV
jgi:hypothetical protein